MRRPTVFQYFLLAVGIGLVFAGIFLQPIIRGWEHYRYPNAVHWQGIRLVPGEHQTITRRGTEMLVIRNTQGPAARLTLFLRAEDALTPQSMVRSLCARDRCSSVSRPPGDGDRAAAHYRIGGEAMQIQMIRFSDNPIWIEYNGPPDGISGFDNLVSVIARQTGRRAD